MATFIHIVGEQGVGKSVLIRSLAATDHAQGRKTTEFLEGYGVTREQAQRMGHSADVVYMEYQRREDVDARPGELVISLERVGKEA